MSPILSRNFSLLQLVSVAAIVLVATFSFTYFWEKGKAVTEGQRDNSAATAAYACSYNIRRIEGYDFVKPILFVDQPCESEEMNGIKQKINDIINRYKTQGDASIASVYIKAKNQWIAVNEDEKYRPGSLFKVPILMTVLKMNEDHPGFIDQTFLFNKPSSIHKALQFPGKSIELGKSYTVRELLRYMIQYSDNDATLLLEAHLDPKSLQKMFLDLGLEAPNMYADNYYFTAKDYSLFMRAIYNAGYLTIKDSEYAAELLTKSEFKDGILKGLPANIHVAHKFGESGQNEDQQLHESAIVYLGDSPYLITVMTKGSDYGKLSQLISEISNVVYIAMLNDRAAT